MPVDFQDIDGWTDDNHAKALNALKKSASIQASGDRPFKFVQAALECDPKCARAFFERYFSAYSVAPPQNVGLLTGYFEPEL
ncbi:MAG: MltA domain-containing protein, partial [Hyphomicrobiales bacterium]|nr:MltA domain-containing protein [Hyphomicrobiales bacterium]